MTVGVAESRVSNTPLLWPMFFTASGRCRGDVDFQLVPHYYRDNAGANVITGHPVLNRTVKAIVDLCETETTAQFY